MLLDGFQFRIWSIGQALRVEGLGLRGSEISGFRAWGLTVFRDVQLYKVCSLRKPVSFFGYLLYDDIHLVPFLGPDLC